MDRTPSISRSNSESSLEDLADENQIVPLKTDAPQQQEKPGMTSGRKRAGTWTNAPVPTTPRGVDEKSSEPRTQRRAMLRQPTVATSVPSNETPSKKVENEKVEDKSKIYWKNLPEKIKSIIKAGMQSEGTLSGKALGRLLISIESAFGAKKPEFKAGGSPILRGTQVVYGFGADEKVDNPGNEIKVVESFLSPFLKKNLYTQELEKVRKKVQKNFDNAIDKLSQYNTGSLRPKQVLELDGYKDLMTEVIKPLTDFLLGEKISLKSSGLSGQMKDLLQTVDAEMVQWINEQGPRDLDEQYLLRRSALVSILAIRGISPEWKSNFLKAETDEGYDEYHFMRLNVFYNAFLTHKLDGLYSAIMLNTEGQRADIKILLKSKAPLERQSLASELTPRVRTGGMFEKIGRIFSPAEAEKPMMPVSPRDASVMAKALKESDTRKVNVERKRATELNAYAREWRLADFSPVFMKQLKQKVSTSREEFRRFKDAPAAYCLAQMNTFVQELSKTKGSIPSNYESFRSMLEALTVDEPEKNDQADRQALASSPKSSSPPVSNSKPARIPTLPKTPVISTTGSTIFSAAPAIKLDLTRLKKSPFDAEADSTETEPSDSTEVESEKTTDDNSDQ